MENKYYAVDWEKESNPDYQDLIFLIFFALLFPAIRFILDKSAFEALAKRMILGKQINKITSYIKRKKINKFKESAWKFLYYFSAELIALSVTCKEPWFTNTRYFWEGPGDQVWPHLKIKLKVKGLLLYEGGFYIYSIFALLYWETKRSDFAVTMFHHVIAVPLIVLCYISGFGRALAMLLAIHDGNDVFMEIAKMSKYSGFHVTADIFFCLFAFSWLLLRLICYPFWILRSTCYEVIFIVDKEKYGKDGIILYVLVNAMMMCVLCLNIFWGRLIFRMFINHILKKHHVTCDIRSDDESDEGHQD